MFDVLVGLDDVFGSVESTQLRLVITVGVVGLLVAVLLSYRQLQSWVSERTRPLYGDVVSTTVLVGTCLITLTVVLGVWEQTGTVLEAIPEGGIGEDVIPNAIASFILLVGTVILTRFVGRVIDELLGSTSAVTDHQREVTHRVMQVLVWSVSLVVVPLGGCLAQLSAVTVVGERANPAFIR